MTKNMKSIISNINEIVTAIENDFPNFSVILDQIVGQIVKNPLHVTTFVTFVNVQLSNTNTRKRGLVLLSALLPSCPEEITKEHAIAWLNNSLKNCENERELSSVAFKVIEFLLQSSSKTPELSKVIVSNVLERVIDSIRTVGYKSPSSVPALECLRTCLYTYPGGSGPRRSVVNKYLITYLADPPPSPGLRIAAKCLNALQQVGGGGTDGVNYHNNWKLQQQRVCSLIHKLMDNFFENVTEFGDYQKDLNDVSSLDTTDLPECKTFQNIAYRIINAVVFLQEMLMEPYPVRKAIYPLIILNIINRGLVITRHTLGTHTDEDTANISSYLILIQKHLLQLLQCLITCLDTNLVPWGGLICKVIIDNLKSSTSEDVFSVKALCDLRLTGYETLRLWITMVKAASGIDSQVNTLVPIIINDTTPVKNEINLTVQEAPVKNLSKKARKKMIEQSTKNFAAKSLTGLQRNSENHSKLQKQVCAAALKTVQIIIHHEGFAIKPIMHKQMQEFVIKNLYNIQKGNVAHPYDDESCQIELYKSLIKLTVNHHYNINPPVHYAINLLTFGQTNRSVEISDVCSNGLMILNSIIHPYCATLQIPLDIENVKADLKESSGNIDETILSEEEEMVVEDNVDESEVDVAESNLNGTEKSPDSIDMEIHEIDSDTNENNILQNENEVELAISNTEVSEKIDEVIEIDEKNEDVIEIDEVIVQNNLPEVEISKIIEDEPEVRDEDLTLEEDGICISFVDIVN